MFNDSNRPTVRRLIIRNYLLSTLVIALCISGLIALVGFTVEDDVFAGQITTATNQWLQDKTKQDLHSLPRQGNIHALEMSYYIGYDHLPKFLSHAIEPTWNNVIIEVFAQEQGHFHVNIRTLDNGEKLYTTFNARPYVRSTTLIKIYLAVFLIFLMILVLLMGFFLFRLTRKVSTPLEQLNEMLEQEDEIPLFSVSQQAPKELYLLSEAINSRNARIKALLEREQAFNRDVSHELRTPLAVACGATEILEQTITENRPFFRLKTALLDMQVLTDGILWLGREDSGQYRCSAKRVCEESIEAYQHLLDQKDINVLITPCDTCEIPIPKAVAKVIVGNLLRNAFSYTDKGEITIEMTPNRLSIEDTGLGFGRVSAKRSGFGVGLTLVQRLAQRFNLVFNVYDKSAENDSQGTVAEIIWSGDPQSV